MEIEKIQVNNMSLNKDISLINKGICINLETEKISELSIEKNQLIIKVTKK